MNDDHIFTANERDTFVAALIQALKSGDVGAAGTLISSMPGTRENFAFLFGALAALNGAALREVIGPDEFIGLDAPSEAPDGVVRGAQIIACATNGNMDTVADLIEALLDTADRMQSTELPFDVLSVLLGHAAAFLADGCADDCDGSAHA